ncbi:hypothetical protein ACFPIJ_52255 [Dactylosporangium cerinum]|uniref:Uncharacterized protein n=1 Tax=Dactylosporangium cerinum TaxID=1434730 RepID=A0ABV9WDV6_9ACTN
MVVVIGSTMAVLDVTIVNFAGGSAASHPGRSPVQTIPPRDNPTTKGMIL